MKRATYELDPYLIFLDVEQSLRSRAPAQLMSTELQVALGRKRLMPHSVQPTMSTERGKRCAHMLLA